jgi:hypothetical protein
MMPDHFENTLVISLSFSIINGFYGIFRYKAIKGDHGRFPLERFFLNIRYILSQHIAELNTHIPSVELSESNATQVVDWSCYDQHRVRQMLSEIESLTSSHLAELTSEEVNMLGKLAFLWDQFMNQRLFIHEKSGDSDLVLVEQHQAKTRSISSALYLEFKKNGRVSEFGLLTPSDINEALVEALRTNISLTWKEASTSFDFGNYLCVMVMCGRILEVYLKNGLGLSRAEMDLLRTDIRKLTEKNKALNKSLMDRISKKMEVIRLFRNAAAHGDDPRPTQDDCRGVLALTRSVIASKKAYCIEG